MSSVYSNTIISNNPRAYYRFNESSGSIAHDVTGNGYHATLQGTYAFGYPSLIASDAAATSVYLDAVTGLLSLPYQLAIHSWSAISLEFWTNVEGSPLHVVIAGNGSTTIAYLNGVATAASASAPIAVSSVFDFIAIHQNGTISELALYDYVLSPAQIQADYNASQQRVSTFSTRFILAFNTTRTIASRLRLLATVVPSIPLRFQLAASQFHAIRTRFILGQFRQSGISGRFLMMARQSHSFSSRFFLGVPRQKMIGMRFLVLAYQNPNTPIHPGIQPSSRSFLGTGTVLPITIPTKPYTINGTAIDFPVLCTAPSSTSLFVPAGSLFFLSFQSPSVTTQNLMQDQITVQMSFPLFIGEWVMGPVQLHVIVQGSMLQVKIVTMKDIWVNRWIVSSQFP